jgi:DNA-binding response OmpR family regulator
MDGAEPVADERPLVLVADDDDDIRLLVALRLRRSGFDVVEAADGLEALKSVVANEPDLVVLDVSMPGLDGGAVLRILNARERSPRVLFLSARASVDDRIAGLELGAVDYLVKPFDGAELVARVRAALRRG